MSRTYTMPKSEAGAIRWLACGDAHDEPEDSNAWEDVP